jgi:hypothetical protein
MVCFYFSNSKFIVGDLLDDVKGHLVLLNLSFNFEALALMCFGRLSHGRDLWIALKEKKLQ